MMELLRVGNWNTDTKGLLQYLLILILVSPACLQDAGDIKDYCQWETFEAKCPPDSVIVMTSALYGRMDYGRCVKRDYGYVGCFKDVLHLADARCSGTHQCNITIPDKAFDRAIAKTCPEDLRRYLQASYTCRKVVSPSRKSCEGSDFARPLQTSGILASVVTEETGCGTAETPWLLEVPPGQRVSLSLHDFGIGKRPNVTDKSDVTMGSSRMTHCHVYAIIKEQHPARSTTICGGNERMKHIYESSSNSVEVRILGTTANRHARNFLLEYKAQGCPDVPSPSNGWVERREDSIIIGCNDPVKTWRLTCNDTKWIGIMTNCTSGDTSALLLGTLPHASSVFIVVVVATIVGLVVLIIGLMCLKRVHKRRKPRRMATTVICKGSNPHPGKADRMPGQISYSQAKQQPLLAYNDAVKIEENEYAYVEDVLPFDTLKSTCDNTLNRMKQEKFDYTFARDTGHYTARPSATGELHGYPTMASRHKNSPDIAPQYFVLDCEKGNPEHTCVAKDTVSCEMGVPPSAHRQISFHRDDPRFVPVKR